MLEELYLWYKDHFQYLEEDETQRWVELRQKLLQITDNLDLLVFAHWLSITCAVSCKCT